MVAPSKAVRPRSGASSAACIARPAAVTSPRPNRQRAPAVRTLRTMNWLDVVVILLLAGFTLAAYSSGLIREVITLVAVIAGILIAGALYQRLGADLLGFSDRL